MAEFKFNTSFTAKNGKEIFRGDAILVQDQGRIRTAHIVDIWNNLSAFYVTANVATQDPNTIDRKTPAVRYEGSGYYHLSERDNSGINQDAKFFVLPQEGEDAAIALHAHMTGVSDAVMNPPTVEEGNSGVDTGTPGAKPPSNTQAGQQPVVVAPNQSEQEFDPRDTNRDHIVDKAEKKAAKKEAQEKEGN